MEPKKTFVYRPLSKEMKEIQLLNLHPAEEWSDPVRCTMEHAPLRRWPRPRYETISYAWGDPSKRSQVIADGLALDVPASAEEVLRRVRRLDKDRTLWIDAVCIDQHDDQERGHQVGMMALIYSNTTLGLVWLGWDDSGAPGANAVDTMNVILEDARYETNDFKTLDSTTTDPNTGGERYRVGAPVSLLDINYEPLLYLFGRPWFRRLWGKCISSASQR